MDAEECAMVRSWQILGSVKLQRVCKMGVKSHNSVQSMVMPVLWSFSPSWFPFSFATLMLSLGSLISLMMFMLFISFVGVGGEEGCDEFDGCMKQLMC
jgi:hypothetical protein